MQFYDWSQGRTGKEFDCKNIFYEYRESLSCYMNFEIVSWVFVKFKIWIIFGIVIDKFKDNGWLVGWQSNI